MRSFGATRFGSHRRRPDHKSLRRIQHSAAYIAVTNAGALNQAVAVPLLGSNKLLKKFCGKKIKVTISLNILVLMFVLTDFTRMFKFINDESLSFLKLICTVKIILDSFTTMFHNLRFQGIIR